MKKILTSKFIFILSSLLFLSFIFVVYNYKFSQKSVSNTTIQPEKTESSKQSNSIKVDFDGDGIGETVKVIEIEKNSVILEVYNNKGEKIASYFDDIRLYPTSLYKVVNLNTNSPKQYLQWSMATGPHQIETVFLTTFEGKVQPIYSFDFEKKTMYSPFYTSRGEIVVEDANNDGLREVIENVDEYPVDTPRLNDPEIDKMIRDTFSKSGLSEEIIQANIAIVSRENSGIGRGKKVILAIHSFVDSTPPFFRRLPEAEFEKIAGPLVAASIEIAKKSEDTDNSWESNSFLRYSDLEQDSKDFNSFVRKIWTNGRTFEKPIIENEVYNDQ